MQRSCSWIGIASLSGFLVVWQNYREPLRAKVIRMASTYGWYDYRFIAGMMRNAGWGQATTIKVARIWKEKDLRIPQKESPRCRLWFNDGSCMRQRVDHPNHIWSYIP